MFNCTEIPKAVFDFICLFSYTTQECLPWSNSIDPFCWYCWGYGYWSALIVDAYDGRQLSFKHAHIHILPLHESAKRVSVVLGWTKAFHSHINSLLTSIICCIASAKILNFEAWRRSESNACHLCRHWEFWDIQHTIGPSYTVDNKYSDFFPIWKDII